MSPRELWHNENDEDTVTLSDALTHRDEPSAVLDSESRRLERDERIVTDEDGDRYKRDCRKGREIERQRGREWERVRGGGESEGEIVIDAFLCPATFSEEHSSCMRKRRPWIIHSRRQTTASASLYTCSLWLLCPPRLPHANFKKSWTTPMERLLVDRKTEGFVGRWWTSSSVANCIPRIVHRGMIGFIWIVIGKVANSRHVGSLKRLFSMANRRIVHCLWGNRSLVIFLRSYQPRWCQTWDWIFFLN